MKMNKKGFTLIEVLIVVVIIAVLASLILPRFMGQTERAVIAEAQQMLGAMRRGQMNYMDLAGTNTTVEITACGAAGGTACDAGEFGQIGMTPPSNAKFNFSCNSAVGNNAYCQGVRAGSTGATYDGGTVQLYINGTYACSGADGKYTYAQAGDHTRGCTAE